MTRNSLSPSQLWGACLGNFFEHYDTALFSFLSPFLSLLIFPQHDPTTALILTYAIIPLGMMARPFGALVFGFIGDHYGRRQALFISLGGMSILSILIALSPTYQQVGLIAPLVFCFGRILQNFFAAGEIMGGGIFLLEHAPENRHDLLSSLFNASTIGGILLASAGVSLLYQYNLLEGGWRGLYIAGSITGLFGCLLRKKIPIPSTYQSKFNFKESLSSLFKIFCLNRNPFFVIAFSSGFSYANYSIGLVLMNGFVPLVTNVTQVEMISLNTVLLVLDFCALPLFGWIASKISRKIVMLAASLGVVLTAIPLFMSLEGATLMQIIGIRVCLILFGVAFCAPFYAWAQQLVPQAHRYVILSLSYAIGSQLLGGPTASISLWLFQKTGIVWSVVWYWMFLATGTTLILVRSFDEVREESLSTN